ncbi:MAG: T9SS type A sorting domain-containing protein [Candidatus Neomarinimicrobiota bacterium]
MNLCFNRLPRLLVTVILLIISLNLTIAKDLSTNLVYSTRSMDAGYFDGNRIRTDLENDNMLVSHRVSGHSGMEWPKGAGTYINYASGLGFAGKIGDEIRTAVAEYQSEFIPGPFGSDPSMPEYKLYKINRRDLEDPLSNTDIQNWPAEDGAPWTDVDNDGVYNPIPNGVDHPDFIGDQVIWYVCNDGDSSRHVNFRTRPLGLEIQNTIWGYDRYDHFGDILFLKSLIINKGGNQIDSMYMGIWDDPDIGDAGDDFVGCDSTLGLGFCYNDGFDEDYGSEYVPAIGYDIIQGPIVHSLGDSAFAYGKIIPGRKNLGMTAFVKDIDLPGSEFFSAPNDGFQLMNFMRGLGLNGTPYPVEVTGGSTFSHPGDPSLDTGPNDSEYVDHDIHTSDDRRFLMSSGPFSMAPGDSQEVIVAMIITRGTDALNSVVKLKELDRLTQELADNSFNLSQDTTYVEYIQIQGLTVIADNLNDNGIANNGELIKLTFAVINHHYNPQDVIISISPLSSYVSYYSGNSKLINDLMPWPVVYEVPEEEAQYFYIQPDYSQATLELKFDIGLTALNSWTRQIITLPVEILDYQPDPTVYEVTHVQGRSASTVGYRVIDPSALLGHEYRISFSSKRYADYPYYRTVKAANTSKPIRTLDKRADCSAALITGSAVYGQDSTVDLVFKLDLNCGNNWADGIKVDLPNDLIINWWDLVGDCSYGAVQGQNCVNMEGTLDPENNSIVWGDSSVSLFGMIESSKIFRVNIDQPATYPFTVGWKVWDDGYDGTVAHATGYFYIDSIEVEMVDELGINLFDLTTGEWLLKQHELPDADQFNFPVIDGFKLVVQEVSRGMEGVVQISNGSGPIDPMAGNEDVLWLNINNVSGYPTEQAQGGWFFITHGGGFPNDVESFTWRVFRGSNWDLAKTGVFEMRFTADAITNGMAYNRFSDSKIINVPFELWNIGKHSEDTSDDYRMLPAILPINGNNTAYIFGGDDLNSPAEDDPVSDWVYWGNPDDTSPGSNGYDTFFSPGIGQFPNGGWTEVMARLTLMNWDGSVSRIDSLSLTQLSSPDPTNWTESDTLVFISRGWFIDSKNSLGIVTVSGNYAYGKILGIPEIGTTYRFIPNCILDTTDVYQFTASNIGVDPVVYVPVEYTLKQNYPNPFNPTTTIEFTLLAAGLTKLTVYDLLGREVINLVNRPLEAGTMRIIWNGRNSTDQMLSSGIYFYRLQANDYIETKKMIILK